LLSLLHAEGINPYNVYRADMLPRPQRFPVFVRPETAHAGAPPPLLHGQAELDRHLETLRENNVPLRGLLVVEYAAEPFAPGFWRRYRTINIGGRIQVARAACAQHWYVAGDGVRLRTNAILREEHAVVAENRFAAELRRVFELAKIEWGRADHATFNGRQIVYGIDTNPTIRASGAQRSTLRAQSAALARTAMVEGLRGINSGDGSPIRVCDRKELLARREHLKEGLYIARP
jgi:hypothetical protein